MHYSYFLNGIIYEPNRMHCELFSQLEVSKVFANELHVPAQCTDYTEWQVALQDPLCSTINYTKYIKEHIRINVLTL